MGRDLSSLDHGEIIHRPFLTESVEKFALINKNYKYKDVFMKSEHTSLRADPYSSHWVHLFNRGQYGRSLLLLLIQIERHVRNLFSRAYPTFDPKARIDGYYFTLDMILDQNVCVGKDTINETCKNNARELMTDSALSLFYDCFVSLKGPRIRDRMSHGELLLKDVTKEVVEIVFLLYKELLVKSEIRYESYFHPISELERKIKELETEIKHLRDLEIPKDLVTKEEMDSIDFQTWKFFVKPIEVLRDPDFVQISKFIRILCQIVKNYTEAIREYKKALNQRFQEYLERTLSQPRRETLKNMLKIRFRVVEGGVCCSSFVQTFCRDMDEIRSHTKQRPEEIKKVLKIVENLRVQLSIDKNDWKSASEGVSHLICLSKIRNNKI